MKNLVKMTRSAYSTARANRTLVTPNVALISDENNKVEYLPMNPASDIGIASWEGGVRKYYSLDEWNALATKPTALGVYVFTEQSQFIIHGTVGSALRWSNNENVEVPCVVTESNSDNAILDFAGKSNSQAMLDAVSGGTIEDAPVFTWASGLTFVDGSVPYVPAAGELELIRLNVEGINDCRAALNQDSLVFDGKNIWSSTQSSNRFAFAWVSNEWSSRFGNGKATGCGGIAVCAI